MIPIEDLRVQYWLREHHHRDLADWYCCSICRRIWVPPVADVVRVLEKNLFAALRVAQHADAAILDEIDAYYAAKRALNDVDGGNRSNLSPGWESAAGSTLTRGDTTKSWVQGSGGGDA